ncbi:DegT/DnrJ/EryC1/StrS family aminotransferase [Prodigiosinella confusarubida]|uniref:DegT/DnrJ/EryC1/StrS family aminotransferase n=1 Tax=Serratia sp. (strain ATCC 39006) TaxID=104623 RepID=A0A2I5TIB4_SERS3|nr:DegT/DnrJ/EryC1/StrS family aminotransferase [Serratia sp. ATCC 39006]AUG99979.1 DegT/DnrJ/EryC1/StrS family aminotransferase [Serratia sp. ATCC 39006]AUH04299.1 DegT/DnrJ/EryC1/StrS family aminotransferase [Serratia sp. ATCC 39006]
MKTDFIMVPTAMPDEKMINYQLAIDGGEPVIPKANRKTIFPNIAKEDLFQMMISVQKPEEMVVSEFAEKYRQRVGAPYAIPTASGTSSLHLALVGAGVKAGDEVIVPAFTFIATAQAIVAAKAIPVFADIDPQTYCLDPRQLDKKVTARTKAVMPVHVHGLPADIDALASFCRQHQLALIEDASHAHSATLHGRYCGTFGDAAGQSLMADKNFPLGGEAGIAFFKERESYDRALAFLEESGLDYRMSWVAAAFGISQLDRLDYYDEIRQRNAQRLIDELATTRLFTGPMIPAAAKHSFNMFRIKINTALPEFKDIPEYKLKLALQQILNEEGVFAREWQNTLLPFHLPFQNKKGFGKGYPFFLGDSQEYKHEHFPNALQMLRSTLVLCRELRSPVEYEKLHSYIITFKKVDKNIQRVAEIASQIDDVPPYEKDARLG